MSAPANAAIETALCIVRDLLADAHMHADSEVVDLLTDAEWALQDVAHLVGEAVATTEEPASRAALQGGNDD